MLCTSLGRCLLAVGLALGACSANAAPGKAPGVEEKAATPAMEKTPDAKDAPDNDAPARSEDSESPGQAAKKERPRPELPPEIANLRDRVRYTLNAYFKQPLNTRDYTPGEILAGCLPWGCSTEVSHEGQAINGITCLCWNYPAAGYELLIDCDGHVAARVGYGLQTCPGQMLAVLALSRVPADYPMRAGKVVRSVNDLLEYEKLSCRPNARQALRLAGLAHYLPKGATWKDALGEDWSIERLVDDQLRQPASEEPAGGMYRLVGLTLAVARHSPEKPDPKSPFGRALDFLTEYQRYAFQLQNADGSWNSSIIDPSGRSNDQVGQMRATGYVAAWLALSLPNKELTRPEMIHAIDYLSQSLGSSNARWNLGSLNKSGLEGLMQALNALSTYDQRAFRPFDPPADEPKEESPKTASSD